MQPLISKKVLYRNLFCGLLLFSASAIFAQGNLMVFPKRIVFENGKRSAEMNLANIGKDTARYAISLIHFRMREDGSFEEITTADSTIKFADEHIRFFPKSVVLAPRESQVIRIQQIHTGIESGEYRSHIYFRAIPSSASGNNQPSVDSSLVIHLTPVFGISIPVIIRSGSLEASSGIKILGVDTVSTNRPVLNLAIERKGNKSVYGDLVVNYISPDGKITKLAEVQGVAVYTPNNLRYAKMLLAPLPAATGSAKGKLNVEYKSRDDSALLGQAEWILR
jgi:P pilus assembly chaperone PapD